MYDYDLVLSFLFMSLLFLRQISILKEDHKVNYSPLILTIGLIGSIIHFIISPEIVDLFSLFRESLIPFLISLLFYLVMNVMHQTQEAEKARQKDEFNISIVDNVSSLQDFMSQLDAKLAKYKEEDRIMQDETRKNFKDDMKSLDAIRVNQDIFTEKFNKMNIWHDEIVLKFTDFMEVKLPGIESISHEQLRVLKVSEQEHFNQLKLLFKESFEGNYDLGEEVELLKKDLKNINGLSDKIAKAIVTHTINELSNISKVFEKQIMLLKSNTESITTSLQEGENSLLHIRKESEIVMKQMSLSSSKMNEIQKHNDELKGIYTIITELIKELDMVKSDYIKSQTKLHIISNEIRLSENEQIEIMKEQINSMNTQVEILSEKLSAKIEESLEKLHEHYHIAGDDITQSVQILAKKAQLKGYVQDQTIN